jgi:hypothetical protein
MYYSRNDILSYNALFNFVIGTRGTGKTWQFKDWAISDFLKTGSQFVYVRRYKTEFKDITNFFDDIIFKYPDHEFKIGKGKFLIDGEVAGFYIALSTAITKKSVAYPNVNKIGFDEFILEKSSIHYLPNEVNAFLGLYETIARDRENVRVLFMANSVTIINPYFLFFDLQVNKNKRFWTFKNGDMVVELTDLEEFIAHKKETRFAKIIDGTDFSKYSIDGDFVNDNYEFIESKTPNSYYCFTLVYKGENIGVWCDNKIGCMYISNKVDLNFPLKYAITTNDHKPNMIVLSNKYSRSKINILTKMYEYGCLRYESLKLKAMMFDIFKILNIAKI